MTVGNASSKVLRVGLTGHRPNHLIPEREAAIRRELERLLELLQQSAEQVDHPAGHPVVKRFTCGLAPGADWWGAPLAGSLGWDLQLVLADVRSQFFATTQTAISSALPTDALEADPKFQWERDHHQRYVDQAPKLLDNPRNRVLELQQTATSALQRDAFELVGEIILEQSDLLIAVWDGLPARGLGGTAHIARAARAWGIPLVWIHATEAVPPTVYLPNSQAVHELEALRAWLHDNWSAPERPTRDHHAPSGPNAAQRQQQFCSENTQRSAWFPPLFHALQKLGGKSWPRWPLRARHSAANWESNWQSFRDSVNGVDPPLAEQIGIALQRPFLAADHLAEVHGRAYRGSYVLIYLLAGLATAVGLISLFQPQWKTILVSTELVMILLMAAVASAGQRGRWHERWLEYRALAEQLRQARNGIWSGQSLESGPAQDSSSTPGQLWVQSFVRAQVQQLPMINARMDQTYLRTAVQTLRDLEISEQLRFNRNTAQVQEHVHERLEHIEIGIFALLVITCVAFLIIYPANTFGLNEAQLKLAGSVMTFIGACVPAVGAALLGVRSQGEFGAYAQRCNDTAQQLEPVQQRADALLQTDATINFQDLVDLTDQTTAALAHDVNAWRTLYRRKQLTVSA